MCHLNCFFYLFIPLISPEELQCSRESDGCCEQLWTLMLYINREEPLREALVTAEEPIAPERLPPAVAPGGLSQGHRLLPFPAREGDTGGQARVWVTGTGDAGGGSAPLRDVKWEQLSSALCAQASDTACWVERQLRLTAWVIRRSILL